MDLIEVSVWIENEWKDKESALKQVEEEMDKEMTLKQEEKVANEEQLYTNKSL